MLLGLGRLTDPIADQALIELADIVDGDPGTESPGHLAPGWSGHRGCFHATPAGEASLMGCWAGCGHEFPFFYGDGGLAEEPGEHCQDGVTVRDARER